MDKQDAIDFIIQALENNRSQDDIVAELSQRLGAPAHVVAGFVQRTIASYTPIPPIIQADEKPSPNSEGETPPATQFTWSGEPIPHSNFHQPASNVPVSPADSPLAEARTQPPTAWDPDSELRKSLEPLSSEDEARLEKLILTASTKNRRQSDVVMIVCEETGMGWNQAQRLVAKVTMKNRKKLNLRENLILIPLALAALIAGLALESATSSELYTFYNLYLHPETYIAGTTAVIDRYTVWAAIAGIPLILGGIAGLVLAIRKLFE